MQKIRLRAWSTSTAVQEMWVSGSGLAFYGLKDDQ